jgi:hypothetical protein
MVVSLGSPEAMEQFNESEIGVDPQDGWQYFMDGWGRPILWLRWAPGFSNTAAVITSPLAPTDIQTGDPTNDHDPFDVRNVDNGQSPRPNAFRLTPLIYSAGADGYAGISIGSNSEWTYNGNPYQSYIDSTTSQKMWLGSIMGSAFGPPNANTAFDNITNHHIEQR